MKTTMKNRMISALLALAMLVSFLPNGLSISALAANPNMNDTQVDTLEIYKDNSGTWKYRVHFSGLGPANSPETPIYAFALVPNAALGKTLTPSEQINSTYLNSEVADPETIESNMIDEMGVPAGPPAGPSVIVKGASGEKPYDENGGWLFEGDMPKDVVATIAASVGKVTSTGATVAATDTSIEMCAFLWRAGEQVIGKITTWSAGGLIVTPDVTVQYKVGEAEDFTSWKWQTGEKDAAGRFTEHPEWGVDFETSGGYPTIYYTVRNATGQRVKIKGAPYNDVLAGITMMYIYGPDDDSTSIEEGADVFIEPEGSIVLTVQFDEDGSSDFSNNAPTGTGKLPIEWIIVDELGEELETGTTVYANFTLETVADRWDAEDIEFTVRDTYDVTETDWDATYVIGGSIEQVLTYHGDDTTFNPANQLTRDVGNRLKGFTVEYYLDSGTTPITTEVPITEGSKIKIRVTPGNGVKANVRANEANGPEITVKAGGATANVYVTMLISKDARYPVTAQVATGQTSWGKVGMSYSVAGVAKTEAPAASVTTKTQAPDGLLPAETVTLTAHPEPGYYFTGWDDGSTDNPHTVTPKEEKEIYTASFAVIPIVPKKTPNAVGQVPYGTGFSFSSDWQAGYDNFTTAQAPNYKYPITYTVSWGGLDAHGTPKNDSTTAAGVGGVGISAIPNTIPVGTYTVTVTASNGIADDYTWTQTVKITAVELKKPTGTGTGVTINGASDGKVTNTTTGHPSVVTYELYKSDKTTKVGNFSGTTYSGLPAGDYYIKGNITGSNYVWDSSNGWSDVITVPDKRENPPDVTQTQTYDKNDSASNAALINRASSVTFNFSVGDWQTLESFKVGGSSTELVGASGVTVTPPSGGIGSITIPATVLDNLNLSNGNGQNVVAVFGRTNATPATRTVTKPLLNVQTTYVVSFVDNDGTTALTPAHSSLTKGVTSGTPSFTYADSVAAGVGGVPTKTGYTFAGWAKTANATAADWSSASGKTLYDPSGGGTSDDKTAQWNTTVCAVWEPNKYTVTFNENKASGQVVSGMPSAIANVPYNTTVTQPADPASEGYTFGGWYKETNCTSKWDFTTDKVKSDTTLYAKWTPHNYTVIYDANGHGTAPGNQNVSGANPTFTAAGGITGVAGYTFNGWNTKANGSGTNVTAGAANVSIKTLNGGTLPHDGGSVTLYAQWSEDQYTVNYDANGIGTAPNTVHTLTATNSTFNAEGALTYVGQTFKGWNTKSDGTGVPVAAGETNVDIKTLNGGTLPHDGGGVTLYAQWEVNKYTVTFNENKASGQVVNGLPLPITNVTHNTTISAPTAPTSAGYKFDGWYKEAACTNAWNFGTDKVTSNITLYAKWLENTFTVTANKNGAAENGKTFVLVGNTDGSVISGTKGSGSSSNVTTFHAVPAGQTYTIHEGDASKHDTTGYPAQSVTVGGNTAVILHYYQVNVAKPVKAEDTSVEVTGGTSYIGTAGNTTAELLYNSSTKGSAAIGASESDPDYVFSEWVGNPANGGTVPTQEDGGSYRLTANNTNIKGPITLTPHYSKNTAAMTITVTKDGKPVNEAEVFLDGTSKGETNSSGVIRITGLTANPYVVTTDVGTGQRAVKITGTTDVNDSLNYYTVSAVASSPSAQYAYVRANGDTTGTDTSLVFLEAKANNSKNVAAVVAGPNPGYKTPAKWSIKSTTYQADGTANTPTTDTSKTGSPLTVTVNATIEATASFDPIKITLGDGAGSVVWGNTITSLSKVPAVGYEQTYASDTPDYYVLTDDADTTSWGTSREKNGIKLERNDTNTGWKVSGTPTSATITSVTFDIRVVSDNGTEATNTVTITISKAPLNRVKVTDIKTPTPGTNPSGAETADLPGPDPDPSSNPYYGDDTDGKFGDEEATVTWKGKDGKPVTGPFKYGEPYTAEVVVKPDGNHVFADEVTTEAEPTNSTKYPPKTEKVKKDLTTGTVTVTYTFPALYKIIYDSNGADSGTWPTAPVDMLKATDTVTLPTPTDPVKSGYDPGHLWAADRNGTATPQNEGTTITVSDYTGYAKDGVITLYYYWGSKALNITPQTLNVVYNMTQADWERTDHTYQGRVYPNAIAPGVPTVNNSTSGGTLTFALVGKDDSSTPPDWLEIDSTTGIVTLKAGAQMDNVGDYQFRIKVDDSGKPGAPGYGLYTLKVNPIELDHATLSALTAPSAGTPVSGDGIKQLNKVDTKPSAAWKGFYSGVENAKVSVAWSPDDTKFKNGQVYTATIELDRNSTNYKFVDQDANSTITTGWTVDNDKAVTATTTGEWTYTVTDAKVTLKRTFPLTGISTTATLSPKAWNQLTVSGFTADTQVPVNMYYLIYDAPQTFADAAAVRAAYTGATVGTGGVIAMGTQGDVKPDNGVATYPGQPFDVTAGVVGDHTYYLYVVAEAVSDTTVLATANDDAATPKKLTLSHNGYGKVDWTGNTNIPDVGTSKTLPANADLSHNTTNTKVISMFENGTFTATPNDPNKFGFVKWTLAKSGAAAADAGTTNKYDYKASGDGANTNDETLHAIFHRKINGTFSIGDDGKTNGKTYTPNLSAVNIGAVRQTTQAGLESNDTVTYQWYYGASSLNAGTDTGWTAIPGATSFTWTNTNDDYPGSAFRLKITYHDDLNGGDNSWIAAKTGASVVKLATPDPDLTRVEVKDNIDHPDGSNEGPADYTSLDLKDQTGKVLNQKEGGLHLVFAPIGQDTGADDAGNPVKEYQVTVTGGGKTLTATIKPGNQDTTDTNYHYYWPANLTSGPVPGTNYKVEVQAIARNDAYTSSEKGDDAVLAPDDAPDTAIGAGYKELTFDMLTASFTDKVFNGTAQTGGTVTAPDGAGSPNKTVTVTYAPTVGGAAAAKQTSVNLAENKSPAPSDGTNPDHDYYIYVSVAQGTLYLALEGQFEAASTNVVSAANAQVTTDNGKVNTDRTNPHADWEIVQAKATMSTITPPSGKQTGEAVNVLNGKTTTTSYAGAANGKYKEGGNTTKYYNITYYLRSIKDAGGSDVTDPVWTAKIGTAIPLTGTAGECMTSFIPNVGANYNFEAVATYSDEADDQFKADVSEVSQTFTYAIGVRTITKIDLLRHEAWNGTTGVDRKDAANNSLDPTWNVNRAVTYGNSEEDTGLIGFYDAGTAPAIDADAAKQMRLEGLKLYITYSNSTHSEHVLQADGTWDVPLPAGYTYTWNSSKTGTANAPAITDRYLTFKGAGVDTGLSITSTPAAGGTAIKSNDVTYTMAKRPLPYKIEATNSTETAPENIDWAEKAEKLWNNNPTLDPSKDKARDGTPLKLRTVVTDAFALADSVGINANGYKSRNPGNTADDSTVGTDRVVVAKNAQPSGGYAAFYRTGTATNDTIDIYPARVTKLAMTMNAPSTNTNNDENKVSNGRYAPNTNDRTDETDVKHNNNTVWKLPAVSTTWEVWTGDDADGKALWEPVSNTSYFAIDKVYRATVVVEADNNHYMSEAEIENYTLNGKKNGDKPIDDLDDWNDRDENVVTVTVDQTGPFHDDWHPDDEVNGQKVLFHNRTTFTYVFHTFLTPSLQFSDEKGSFTTPNVGTDHERSNYVHHTEVVNKGAGEIVYTISVNASVKDIFGAQVIMTNKELTNKGATLTVVQGNGDADTATPVTDRVYHDAATNKDYNKMFKIAEGADVPYKADKDLIIYELKIPASVTADPGIYHLELQAMGSTSLENWRADKVDVAKSYYTFTLEVLDDRPTGNGGTTTIETPIVRYWISDYGYTNDLTAEKMPRAGAKPSFTPKITPMAGLRFLGWSETDPTKLEPGKLPTLVDPLTFTIDEDKIFYAVYEWVGHSHYVIGFPDGTFGPDNSITRGQVATIIARACLEGFVEGSDYGNPGNYSDVGDHWAASAVAYCSLRGVFAGYEDGTFRPDRYISRQELATVVARLAGVQANQGLTFTDSGDVASWALNGVYTNVANGWVNGYEDNTFRPLQNITRAETVKIFNGYLGRGVDAKGLEGLTEYVHSGVASNNHSGEGEENKEYMTWPDVSKAHWAYFEVIEAANDHDYHWQDNAKATPPEQWDAAYIDETWRYYDNENDGGQNVGLEAKTFTVTYMIPDGEPVTETVKIYESPSVEGLPQLTAPEGFYLAGWSLLDPSLNEITENDLLDPTAHWVEEDRTYYPVFEKIPEYVMPDVVVTYDIGVHGTTTGALTETVKMYESPTVAGLPKITAEAGYRFAGWTRKDPAVYEIATEDLEDPTASPVLEDTTFYAVYVDRDGHVLPTVVVTYVIGEQGATAMATTELVEMYESPTVEALPNVAANEGWQFLGWSETDPATLAEGETPALVDPTASPVTADKSFYAVYTPAQPGETQPPEETEQPEETQQPEQVTVTYLVSSNGVTYDSISETLAWGTAPAAETLPIAVPNPGYRFAGWSATDPSAGEISLVDPTATAITEDRNFYAVFQPEEIVPPEETPQPPVDYDRTSYINGFGEGEFRPDEAINRAAVASIIANLNGYDAGQQYSEADGYADLEGHWAKNVIAFCIQKGLLSGYEDGTFRPDRSISRQEFAVVISRMAGIQSNEGLSFTDVDAIAPWALDGVYTAYVNGWIGGYEDGSFLPEKSITRAEAVKVFNAYLGRSANPAAIQAASGYTVWNDVADTHWAYYEIIEASNNWEEPLPAPEESEEPQPPEETTPVDEGDPSQLPSGEEVKPVDNGETVNPSDEEDAEPDQSGDAGPEPEPVPGERETE